MQTGKPHVSQQCTLGQPPCMDTWGAELCAIVASRDYIIANTIPEVCTLAIPLGRVDMALDGSPCSSQHRRRRRDSDDEDDYRKRLRLAQQRHKYPPNVTGNLFYSLSNRKTFMDLAEVHLKVGDGGATAKFKFKAELMQYTPAELSLDHPLYRSDRVRFSFAGMALQPGQFRQQSRHQNFAKRAEALCEAAQTICFPSEPHFRYISRPAQTSGGDSDDDGPRDDEVVSPFSTVETANIDKLLSETWGYFAVAQQRAFHNAPGKYFLTHLFRLCTMVDKDSTVQAYMSTNPNGDSQPGSMKCGWCIQKPALREESSDATVIDMHNRVADAVMFDTEAGLYTVVAEVKGGDDVGGGLEQNVEQMLGLFQCGQTRMLGIVLDSANVRLLFLQLKDDTLTLRRMLELSLLQASAASSMMTLVKIIIGMNSVCGP